MSGTAVADPHFVIQGYLTDAQGQPVTASESMSFSIVIGAGAPTSLSTQTVEVSQGRFSAVYSPVGVSWPLGAAGAAPGAKVRVKIGESSEMEYPLGYAAYAAFSEQSAAVGRVTSAMLEATFPTSGQNTCASNGFVQGFTSTGGLVCGAAAGPQGPVGPEGAKGATGPQGPATPDPRS
jgi:hypothetical protein